MPDKKTSGMTENTFNKTFAKIDGQGGLQSSLNWSKLLTLQKLRRRS
jgi:hypothetical protein